MFSVEVKRDSDKPVLVAGSTGYVGGRLVPRLLEAGHRVRALGRSLDKLRCRPWASDPNVELARGDVLDQDSLESAAAGCRAVFYLVHSMKAAKKGYAAADRQAAQNMVTAAAAGGVERIIYLGGLGDETDSLSDHLRSRAEVGRILTSGPVPTTYLRAAMILGAGSASFELLRYLADRLPMMITPRWVRTRVQPIAIANVLGYLIGCLENEATTGRTLDIGGPDVVSYAELFQMYARLAGLRRRWIIPVPFFSPRLSSYWIHLVTPLPASMARPLAEGLRNTVVVGDDAVTRLVPQKLIGCQEAISRALERVRQQSVETCWMDAGRLMPPEWPYCDDAPYSGGTVYETGWRVRLQAEAEDVWAVLTRLGGRHGWHSTQAWWRLRGMADRLVGGVGLRRGRRDQNEVLVGDAVDFWRVLRL
ncbi:MAG: SDR family oxidoreductase, partial [Proteobacteria bacterium]|nr:SDR family oxidoreductase [Pseudomonadota bacterium]MBU1741547.1 SDR family oxidoreductase [Pseudomonadota bacterium]